MSRYNDTTPEELKDYQPVKDRIRILYELYPDARIVTEIVKAEKFEAIFKASVYRDYRDQKDGLPLSTGFSQEFQDEDNPFNSACWFEVSETSAIGRALRNASIGDLEKPSLEEMQKPIRHRESKPVEKNWDFPIKKSVSEKPYNEKKYEKRDKSPEPQGIKVEGPKVHTNFTFKKINPKLSEDEIKNYQVPNGVHKGKYLDQIEYAELVEYTAFLQNSPRVGEWAKKLINVSTQFQNLNN